MSDIKFVRAATLDRIGDLVDDTAGVHLRDLPPFTTLRLDSELTVSCGRHSLARGLLQGRAFLPDLVIFDGLRNLPHFNPDVEAGGAPVSVAHWRLAVLGSDAVRIASPEHRFSLPGVLKNGLDWLIGSGELEQGRGDHLRRSRPRAWPAWIWKRFASLPECDDCVRETDSKGSGT